MTFEKRGIPDILNFKRIIPFTVSFKVKSNPKLKPKDLFILVLKIHFFQKTLKNLPHRHFSLKKGLHIS